MRVVLRGGYYDISRWAELEAELGFAQPRSDVILDLSHTEHLDCGSLGLLIGRLNAWRNRAPGTELRLVNVRPRLAEVLTLLELDSLFVIENVA